MNSRFPVWFLSVAIGLTGLLCVSVGWNAWQSQHSHVFIQKQATRFEELRGTILRLDEVLTMSAQMAAATGEARWEQRYRQFELQLDAAIKEAIRLDPDPRVTGFAQQTDVANLKLVEMENRAFDFVRAGNMIAARAVLFSPAYEEQKQVYADGIRRLLAALTRRLDAANRTEASLARLSLAAAFVGLLLAVAVWVVVMRRLRCWGGELNVAVAERTAALAASELRYRRLFEAAKDGILILDAETGLIVDVNPFLIELLGFSHEEFLGKKVWELGFFKDIIANQDHFAELQAQEYIRYDDKPLETTDGRRIPVEFVSNVYQVNGHKVIQCNIRDISERKQAELALQGSPTKRCQI